MLLEHFSEVVLLDNRYCCYVSALRPLVNESGVTLNVLCGAGTLANAQVQPKCFPPIAT